MLFSPKESLARNKALLLTLSQSFNFNSCPGRLREGIVLFQGNTRALSVHSYSTVTPYESIRFILFLPTPSFASLMHGLNLKLEQFKNGHVRVVVKVKKTSLDVL